jgi:hypothetical protein
VEDSLIGGQDRPEVSFVVPLFDEEANVAPLWEELRAAAEGLGRTWEAVLVDDGSRDGTRAAVVAIEDPRARLVALARHYGQTAALQAGLDAARARIVVTLDGDLQNDPADIPRLLALLERGHDLVCGWRRGRRDPWLSRRLPSAVANRLIGWLTGMRLHDHGCTLRAYRGEVVERVQLYGDMHRFVGPWLAIAGCRWAEIEVTHRARRHGRSKYGLARTWKVALDLLTVAALGRFATRPGLGLAMAALPFVALATIFLGASGLAFAAAGPGPLPVVLPSMTVLCAFAAAHLFLLAFLGELVVAGAEGDERALTPLQDLRSRRRP